jgi:hypothetical protein
VKCHPTLSGRVSVGDYGGRWGDARCLTTFRVSNCDMTGVPGAGPRFGGQAVVWATEFVVIDVLLRLARWRVTAGALGFRKSREWSRRTQHLRRGRLFQ